MISISLLFAVSAFVWIAILVQPYGIFDFVPKVFQKAPERVSYVLFQCEKCFAGQLALWTYPLFFWEGYKFNEHILVILFSIFFAAFIGKIYNRL